MQGGNIHGSDRDRVYSCRFLGDNMLGLASKITHVTLNGIKDSGVHKLTIYSLNPLGKVWSFQMSTYSPEDWLLYDFHPTEKRVAWSSSHLGVYLCNYEGPEQPIMLRDRGFITSILGCYALTQLQLLWIYQATSKGAELFFSLNVEDILLRTFRLGDSIGLVQNSGSQPMICPPKNPLQFLKTWMKSEIYKLYMFNPGDVTCIYPATVVEDVCLPGDGT